MWPNPVRITVRWSARPSPSRSSSVDQVGGVGDVQPAVAPGEAHREDQAVGEDAGRLEASVAVAVLQHAHPTLARPGGDFRVEVKARRLGDEEPPAVVECREHREPHRTVGRGLLDGEAGRDMKRDKNLPPEPPPAPAKIGRRASRRPAERAGASCSPSTASPPREVAGRHEPATDNAPEEHPRDHPAGFNPVLCKVTTQSTRLQLVYSIAGQAKALDLAQD